MKAAGATFAALYVLGLVVVNLYLAEFGFFAFSYTRPQYILTGLWALLTFAATMIPAACAVLFVRRSNLLLAAAGWTVLLAAAPAAWFAALKLSGSDAPPLFGATAAFFCSLEFVLTLRIWKLPARGKSAPIEVPSPRGGDERVEASTRAIVAGLLTAFNLLLFAEVFSFTVYKAIPPAYGGGRPQRARLVLDGGATADLVKLGFPVREGTGISLPLTILGETGDESLIDSGGFRLRIQRGMIKGVNPKPDAEDIIWERRDFYEVRQAALAAEPADCPPASGDTLSQKLKRAMEDHGIPESLPRRMNLEWQCGQECYQAVRDMESVAREERDRCKAAVRKP